MKMRKFLIRNIKKARDQIDGKLIITPKSKDGDLVTNFDTKVEKFLIKKIKRTYPNFDIISEELNGEKKVTKNCFIIDPIDGTNNFARKIPVWGMQIPPNLRRTIFRRRIRCLSKRRKNLCQQTKRKNRRLFCQSKNQKSRRAPVQKPQQPQFWQCCLFLRHACLRQDQCRFRLNRF